MKRRLYFLLPDRLHTRLIVDELEAAGIDTGAMHTIAKPGVDLSGLPAATDKQCNDFGARVETILWDGNLLVFLGALLAMIIMVFMSLAWQWLLLPAVVMLLSFVTGIVFTSNVPNVHLSEFRDAIHHGEILLMIDVPVSRVEKTEALIHRHHPEAIVGGVGWHVDALHT